MTSQQKRILLSLAFLAISLFVWQTENPAQFKAVMHDLAVMLSLTCEVECGH